ncbi:hypothetical protein CLOSYM_04974 [[Clostridium] symbiosum ATCC 14940]|uniref:Uncharacterized protein n=1 Tax=[Clostridium] symbiosum ATCC 14940 TaxID=411472 RepID=A0ABC9TQ04_CLOSY|nr:hypothetical protein CLOSYM_04974 [[Clostridium] symbiosum ATCC 14940]
MGKILYHGTLPQLAPVCIFLSLPIPYKAPASLRADLPAKKKAVRPKQLTFVNCF